MSKELRDKIKPLYEELKQLQSTAPTSNGFTYTNDLDVLLNDVVDQIEKLTGQDYSIFKYAERYDDGSKYVENQDYRSKVASLIGRLSGEYFPDESSGTSPHTVISLYQVQQQSVKVMVLEIKEKIDAELPETEEGSAENTFLKKLSSALPLINGSADLIKTTVELAKECGVSLDSIHRFFS